MLAEQFAIVLGIPAESIDLETALPDLGMIPSWRWKCRPG